MINLDAEAAKSAAEGQAQLKDYVTKANTYKGQYSNFQKQASAANKNVNDYTTYMKGAGSAGNQYHTELTKQEGDLGYDPEQMTAARGNLNQANGALSAYSDFANTSASKFGLNAGGFAAANAGALGGLNNNIASNQGVVKGLTDIYGMAQTGANRFTGQVIQGEQTTMAGLQQVYANAANQRDSASSMMNFYDKLASDQGGLNAQEQQYYAAAKQAYASATAAMAQAGLYAAQAAQTQQQVKQGSDYMSSPAYKSYLSGTSAAGGGSPSTPTKNGGGGPSILQDNLDFFGHTAPHAVATGAKAVYHGAGSLLGKIF